MHEGPYAQLGEDFPWDDDLLLFDRQCHAHDWFYMYSDDHGVWSRGTKAQAALNAKAETSLQHMAVRQWHVDEINARIKKAGKR